MINNPIIYKFFKDFTNHKKKTNRLALLSCRPFLNILKYRDQRWALPIIWKTRLLQTHIDEFSYMYERSGSQLRATTGIKSGTDAFGKSRFVVTFWAILGVTEMCFAVMQFHISSRRENRWRDTWVDKIRVPRKVFGKQFSFIRCRGQHLQAVEQRRYGRFTFVENTISNSPKAPRAKFPDSFLLLAYASLKASRILLQQLAAYLNFNLDSEVLFCWCKPNKWFLWTMPAAQAAKKHGDEWGLIWYLRWEISNLKPLTKVTSSSRSTEF